MEKIKKTGPALLALLLAPILASMGPLRAGDDPDPSVEHKNERKNVDPLADTGLPPSLIDLVLGYTQEPLPFDSNKFPFYDLETDKRFGPGPDLPRDSEGGLKPRGLDMAMPGNYHWVMGYGQPFPFHMPFLGPIMGQVDDCQMLSYRDGYSDPSTAVTRRVLKKTAGGFDEVTLTGHVDRFVYEDLRLLKTGQHSSLYSWSIEQRGLRPLAGVPGEHEVLKDGHGFKARVSAPRGLACAHSVGPARKPAWVFTEGGFNVVRLCSEDGEVTTLCGSPSEADFVDGKAAVARFNNPSHLAIGGAASGQGLKAYVSDSGNNAIRSVTLNTGTVETVWKDGLLNPQGILADHYGLTVADQGHHTIAFFNLHTSMTQVLAGATDQQGDEDGQGDAARFFDLRGLAEDNGGFDATKQVIYILDGNAIRRMDRNRRVTTLVGSVRDSGYVDSPDKPMEKGVACFNHPTGIVFVAGCLFVTDTSNHCIRKYDVAKGTLETVAGCPGINRNQFGLLRDGLAEFPEDAGYATLCAPQGLALKRDFSGHASTARLAVGAVSILGDIPMVLHRTHRDRLALAVTPMRERPVAGAPLPVTFTVAGGPALPAWEHGRVPYDFRYVVEWETDGDLKGETVRKGTAQFGVPVALTGPHAPDSGNVTLKIRCVTIDGCSVAASRKLDLDVAPSLWTAEGGGPAAPSVLKVPAGGYSGDSRTVPCSPGDTILGSCLVGTQNMTKGSAQIGIRFDSDSEAALGWGAALGNGTPSSASGAGPTRISILGVAPMGATRAYLYVACSPCNEGAEASFSAVSFTKGASNLWPPQAGAGSRRVVYHCEAAVGASGYSGDGTFVDCREGDVFLGTCSVRTENMKQGIAHIGLRFESATAVLDWGKPVGDGTPTGSEGAGPAEIAVKGVAPAGATRVRLFVECAKANEGAKASFSGITFHRSRPGAESKQGVESKR